LSARIHVCRGKLSGKAPEEIEMLKKVANVWEPQVCLQCDHMQADAVSPRLPVIHEVPSTPSVFHFSHRPVAGSDCLFE
jgi:hypothetical protein